MNTETLFVKDRAAYFLNHTILNPSNAQKIAQEPEITETSASKMGKEETIVNAVREIRGFTYTEVNSLLRNILFGFAKEPSGWNKNAIRASLKLLPFIGFKKITSWQIAAEYKDAIVTIMPYHTEATSGEGFKALIEAGMILLPHMSTFSRKTIDIEVIPVLREELNKRLFTKTETYEELVGKINNLENALKTGIIKPIEIIPKDTTQFANKFREFSNDLRYKHFSSGQFDMLDSLIQEAIRDFGMNAIQIMEMSGIPLERIKKSISRLKSSNSLPDKNVHDNSLILQVEMIMGKGLTVEQTAHTLGPGITKGMVVYARRILREKGFQEFSQPQEKISFEQDIINLRQQGFSRSQIIDQLNIPAVQVHRLINKLIREGKLERQILGHLPLNQTAIERGIRIDAHVDEIRSDNTRITLREIAQRLNLSISGVRRSLQRLNFYMQIEQLIQQGKTSQQIADAMGIDEAKAKFDIARLQKLRDFQNNLILL